MKLLRVYAENFGSYKSIDVNLTNRGLTLVQGPTGCGKSTLLSLPCWILFGQTDKGGSVEEIRSWQANGEDTSGTMHVRLGAVDLTITRIRGKINDLYFQDDQGGSQKIRGKDLKETQLLLDQALGCTYDEYVAGAYYHEFSPAGNFFVASATRRRELFEGLADLALPTRLSGMLTDRKREVKYEAGALRSLRDKLSGKVEALKAAVQKTQKSLKDWHQLHDAQIRKLAECHENFEKEKTQKIALVEERLEQWGEEHRQEIDQITCKISSLESSIKPEEAFHTLLAEVGETIKRCESERCETCGGPSASSEMAKHKEIAYKLYRDADQNHNYILQLAEFRESLRASSLKVNPYIEILSQNKAATNQYQERIQAAATETNPHSKTLVETTQELSVTEEVAAEQEAKIQAFEAELSSLSHLLDLCAPLRSELIRKAVSEIQDATNKNLETYFDGELRVTLFPGEGDKLDVEIQKSGYLCEYTQLSKGQRGILKLCFAVAVMRAASNKVGIHYDNLFFDEALDGMDSNMKLKAIGLFEELAKTTDSVFIVEHDTGVQAMLDNKILVTLNNDCSEVSHET